MVTKVCVVGTVGIPACYGGFESLVENLTQYQSDEVDYTVFCAKASYPEKLEQYNGANLVYIPLHANGVQSIPYDVLSLLKCWFLRPRTVLILGVSGCLFLPVFKLFSSAKVVTNIDGLEWKRDKWGTWARRFLKWSEAAAVKFSDVIVTDNKAISEYVESEYGKENVTIAYGGDHAIRQLTVEKPGKEYALGLCRIEPENNIEMILEAFSHTDRHLKFVGNWGSSDFGRELKIKYKDFKNIELLDPIYDLDELYKLRRACSLYVHGHSAGGTNPSLVEMMHFGVPIFAYDCNFNRYSTEAKARYFSSPDSLVNLMEHSTAYELKLNGIKMQEIANTRYRWDVIANLYESLF